MNQKKFIKTNKKDKKMIVALVALTILQHIVTHGAPVIGVKDHQDDRFCRILLSLIAGWWQGGL